MRIGEFTGIQGGSPATFSRVPSDSADSPLWAKSRKCNGIQYKEFEFRYQELISIYSESNTPPRDLSADRPRV